MTGRDELSESDLAELGRAERLLENPRFIAKVADLIGRPVDKIVASLPARATTVIRKAATSALEKSLVVAVRTSTPRVTVRRTSGTGSPWVSRERAAAPSALRR